MNFAKQKVYLSVATVIFFTPLIVFGQNGGNFAVTQSVIASGGGQNSSGGAFAVDGTIGQAAAGNTLTGLPFAVTSGFWNFSTLAPTAAGVTVGGRVITADGRGIRNVGVQLIAPNGEIRYAITTPFGNFRFNNILSGETYIFTVQSKRYTFSQPAQVRFITEETADIVFIADL